METLNIAPWQRRLDGLETGKPISHRGLCAYPLLGQDRPAPPYILLDQALAAGTITIEEVGAGGSVPELRLVNKGNARVLLLDGEELVGAKQNRIVNTSVLVDAHSEVLLPVSCVEAGRWRHESAQFRTEGSHYNARGRQEKVKEVSASLEREGRARADQGRVWADIDRKLASFSVPSETRALHDVTRSLENELEAFGLALGRAAPNQVGAAFALGRDLIGLDLFDRAETLAAVLPKLVASYALDALEERPTSAPPPAPVVQQWLADLSRCEAAAHPAVALGRDIRLAGPGVSGAALEVDDAVVHLSAFRTNAAAATAGPSSRLARASVRRQRIY